MPEKRAHNHRTKLSHRFITALSIVSIVGFLSIISETLFGFDFGNYAEALLMLVIGAGLIAEVHLKKLRSVSRGLNPSNITHLITVIIGFIAIIAAIFSFPMIRIENGGFLAIKGIVSIIAIAVIIIQTWVID